jgi:hypothetical protein
MKQSAGDYMDWLEACEETGLLDLKKAVDVEIGGWTSRYEAALAEWSESDFFWASYI